MNFKSLADHDLMVNDFWAVRATAVGDKKIGTETAPPNEH